jgi:alkanesulfonate monooxygenase SsuD/methylene tetrahydromethanopterin reductase-like flavin-dependent oxidoreductase (luciferase family)
VHDIADLEARGVVGVFIASEVFVQAAAAQGASLGMEPASLFVAHPIQDRTDDEMRALADTAIDELLARLTSAGEPKVHSVR